MSPIPLPLPPLITPSGNFGTFQIGGRSNVSLPVDDYDIVNKLYVDTMGAGFVRPPASSLVNTIPLFADTTGKLLSDSTLLVTAGNQISNVSSISLIGTGSVTISANATSNTYQLVLPQSQGAPNSFLRNDGVGNLDWGTPLGGGNVTGPISSTTNAIALYFNTTGTIIKNSTVLVSSTGGVSGVTSLQMTDATSGSITVTPAATTTAYSVILPSSQGVANSFLQNNGTGTLTWGSTAPSATNLTGPTANTVPYQSASGVTSYYTYSGLSAALSGANATRAIYVSNLNGNDSNNGLSPETAVATLGVALTKAASGGLIVIFPNSVTYSENTTITLQNVTIMSDVYNGSCSFSGTITVANTTSNVTFKGITFTTLVHSNSGSLYMYNCKVNTSFTSSGTGFLQAQDTDFQGSGASTMSITGSGTKLFSANCNTGIMTINNASVLVGILNHNNSLPITLTAGTLSINNGTVYAASALSNALTAASGTLVYLQNTNFVVAGSTNSALISIATGAFYSELNVTRSLSSSILGTNLLRIPTFDSTSCFKNYLRGSTSGTLTLQPSATTTSYTLTMPNVQASAGVSSSLVNDGTGTLSWSPTGVQSPSIGIKPVTYVLQSSDQSKIFIYTTGGGTINFTNGSLFSGFFCYVKNGSSTDITLQFNSVNVLGVTPTLHRATGSGNSSICVLYYDGTNLILY